MGNSKLSFDEMAQRLRDEITSNSFIDVGSNAEVRYEVSRSRLLGALNKLRGEGYLVHYIRVTQHGSGKPTTIKVLSGPGVTYKEAVLHSVRVPVEK